MLKLIVTSLILALSTNCIGQSSSKQQGNFDDELLYATPHFSATLTAYLTQKAAITTEAGGYAPTATPAMGAEGGLNYHLHFNKAYSLVIGIRAGVGGRNHYLYIPKESFTPHLDHDVVENGRFTREADLYFSLPVMIERRWSGKTGNLWIINAGVNVRHITENISISAYNYSDVSGQMVNVQYFNLLVGNKRKPWLNYNAGGGYAWRLKNKNFLGINLLANYSTTDIVQGRYTINVTGQESTVGGYRANLSFLGVSFNYILTGENKRKKKLKQREERGH